MSAVIAEPAAGAAPVRRPKKKILVIGLVVLVLAVAVAAAAIFFLKQRAARAAATGDDDAQTSEAAAATSTHIDPKNVPIYLPLDPFIVNLADREADRYAQIGITLEVADEKVGEEIKAYLPAIRNNILLLLAHKSTTDLQGGEGKEKLARQIRRESLRAMGEEVDDDDDDDDAPAAAENAAPKKKKKKKHV
ncbi:MAG: flagellar basal body-associated FliL family protein, partial [Rhizobacter sp.]|nr:flagellar basal body-associated FliL family protein [Rhizobacter sp.]